MTMILCRGYFFLNRQKIVIYLIPILILIMFSYHNIVFRIKKYTHKLKKCECIFVIAEFYRPIILAKSVSLIIGIPSSFAFLFFPEVDVMSLLIRYVVFLETDPETLPQGFQYLQSAHLCFSRY